MTDEELDEIVETLRECAEDSRKVEGDYYADQFATDASVFEEAAAAIERLRAELARLRLTDEEREPVAWALMRHGQVEQVAIHPVYLSGDIHRVAPLYAHSRPILTDAEREAVAWAVSAAINVEHPAEDTLRGLLERLK